MSYRFQKVNRVPRKSRYGFRQDEVNLSGLTVCNKPIEFVTLIRSGAAYSKIPVNIVFDTILFCRNLLILPHRGFKLKLGQKNPPVADLAQWLGDGFYVTIATTKVLIHL